NVRTLHNLFDNLFLFFLLDCALRLIATRPAGLTFANQDMSRVHLFLVFAIFLLGAPFLELDDVKTKLSFHQIADLPRLERKGCFIELRNHLTWTEPAEVAALVFVARVGRKLRGELGKVFTGLNTLQDFLSFRASLTGIQLRMLGDV